MPIETAGSVSTTEVPAGTQVEFEIKNTTFDADGKYGPSVELDLIIADETYYGTQLRYWARVQQPRLDLVRKWRGDGMSDEVIKTALKERGFKFRKVDDRDNMVIGRGGNLYKILTATAGGPRGAEQVLEECDDFNQLADKLVGGRFVGTTKTRTPTATSGSTVARRSSRLPRSLPTREVPAMQIPVPLSQMTTSTIYRFNP